MARRLRIRWGGGEAVEARLAMPTEPLGVGVLLAHGAGAGQSHPFMEDLRDGLARAGYPTMTFDYAYMDAGRRAPDRMPKLLAVHRAAADRLATYVESVIVAGKSMGGRVGSHLVGDEGWPTSGLVYYGYPLVPLGKTEARPTDHLGRIAANQLFFAGSRDRLSPPAAVRPLVRALPTARLHEIDDGDHSFNVPKRAGRTAAEVLDELIEVTTSWIAELIEQSPGNS
ncbi:MAG: hypothetical protein GY720_02970 [bacterium]|nr:hypothetical protein [bacterium]